MEWATQRFELRPDLPRSACPIPPRVVPWSVCPSRSAGLDTYGNRKTPSVVRWDEPALPIGLGGRPGRHRRPSRTAQGGEIDSGLKLDDFASIVDGLAYLFHLAEVRERGIRAAADPIGPIHRFELHVRVARISYNSPLEFLLAMLNLPQWADYGAAVAAAVVATARKYATVRLRWAEDSLRRAETRKILAEASEIEMQNASSAQRREANRKACEFLLEELRPQPLQVDAQRLLNVVKALDAIEDIEQVQVGARRPRD